MHNSLLNNILYDNMGSSIFCRKKVKIIPVKYNNEIAKKIYSRLPTPIPNRHIDEIADLEYIPEISQSSSNVSSSSIQYNTIRNPNIKLNTPHLYPTITYAKIYPSITLSAPVSTNL